MFEDKVYEYLEKIGYFERLKKEAVQKAIDSVNVICENSDMNKLEVLKVLYFNLGR